MKPSRVLTIAGSAARGTAGIQADLKTFQELDVYGMSVVTAIVADHPTIDQKVFPQTIEAIEAQFSTAEKQMGFDTLKTGMLFSKEVIDKTAELITNASAPKHIVVDPVMVGKIGSKLLRDDAIQALKEKLLPLASVIMPNMDEASLLLDQRQIHTVEDLKQAAVDLYELGKTSVLVKGGKLDGPAIDVLYDGVMLTTFEAPRIDTVNTNGAGCTYSAAITAYLAKGEKIQEAVLYAKRFITTAIAHSFSYTDIVGPTYHAAERLFGDAYSIKVSESRV